MECSSTDVGKLPLDTFVQVVATIYSTHDMNRSIWDVWCHALHHAAGVAEQIRIGSSDEKLFIEIADFSLWLFTAVLKLRGEFGRPGGTREGPQDRFIRIQSSCSDLLWQKYPKLCPRCSGHKISGTELSLVSGAPSPCECLDTQPAEQKDARRERLTAIRCYSDRICAEKPESIDEWQAMFSAVYGKKTAVATAKEIALHIMEELGEASDAMIRMYTFGQKTFRPGEPNWRQQNLEGQLADVFSRLFALAELAKGSSETVQYPSETLKGPSGLSGIIWRRYGSDSLGSFYCPFCKKKVCSCPIILVPANTSAEQLIEKFQ